MVRKWLARVVISSLALAGVGMALTPAASADLISQINGMLSPSNPSRQVQSQNNTNASAPLGKFYASGRVTESLDAGACPGSLEETTCTNNGGCDQITITGPVNATAIGKATLSACITVTDLNSSTFSSCLNGFGTGTISGNGGKSINFGIGGVFCLANATPVSNPTTAYFDGTETYDIEGGSGPFTNAVGAGTLSFSDVITNISGPSFPGTGQLTMSGSFAKQ